MINRSEQRLSLSPAQGGLRRTLTFYPLKAFSQGGRKDELIITPWLVMNPRAILKYVLFQFCALGLLLLINFQVFNQS